MSSTGLLVKIESPGCYLPRIKNEMPLDDSLKSLDVFDVLYDIEPVNCIEPISFNSSRTYQPIEPDILSVILAL